MKRVYLDQKDYVRVVHGLGGRAEYRTDVEVYRELEGLVEQDAVRIYFSWVHFTEALRNQTGRPDLLETYCQVVDKLTKGHCVVFPKELQRRELELALAARFGFVTELREADYAYGRCADAVPQSDDDSDMKDHFKRGIPDAIERLPLPRKQKRHLLGLLKNEKNQRRVLGVLPHSTLRDLAVKFPTAE